jgi:hypothetical protein
MERKGGGWRGEVVRRRMERNESEEGGRESVRRRMERKGEKGSEEDLTASLHPSSQSSSLPLFPLPLLYFSPYSSLPLNPPHYFSTLIPLHPLPRYLSPSSSLPLSLLRLNPPHYFSSFIPLHTLPHYLSPSFLSILLPLSILLHPSPH